MGISLKGFRTSTLSSPVMMQEAFAATASSRNAQENIDVSSSAVENSVLNLQDISTPLDVTTETGNMSILVTKDFLQDFFSKSVFFGLFTNSFQQFIKIGQFTLPRQIFNLFPKRLFQTSTQFGRNALPFFSRFISNFYYNPFHSIFILKAIKDTKNSFLNYAGLVYQLKY